MFSALASDHVNHPRNCGELQDATHYGQVGAPGDGPYVQIWLKLRGDTIESATYRCNGCPSTIASSSLIVEMMRGRTLFEAQHLSDGDVITILGGLPEGKEPCAKMATDAFHLALENKR